MAYTTGTATDYADLLDKLRLYAVAQGWTQLAWTAGTVPAGGANLQLRGPGAGVGREVYLNIRTYADVPSAYYYWTLRGATGYTAGAPVGGNPGEMQTSTYFNLWQNSITYWFYVNDYRIIVVAKCSTAYISMYAGFFLPFSSPDQYPFPLYVAADYGGVASWSLANAGRRMFADPGGSTTQPSAWTRSPAGTWIPTFNHIFSSSNDSISNVIGSPVVRMWPFHVGEAQASSNYWEWGGNFNGQGGGGALDSMVATRQNERWLWPVTLVPMLEPAFGVLYGVHAIPGVGLATEQVTTVGARNFRIFQNIQRSSGNDFFAVEEV